MARLDFNLNEFKTNYYIYLTVTTQCSNAVKVIFGKGSTKVFEISKSNSDKSLNVIAQKDTTLSFNDPELSIEVSNSGRLEQSIVSGLITDDKARRVGFVYDFCIESDGKDAFNDVYVNIVGWEKKG